MATPRPFKPVRTEQADFQPDAVCLTGECTWQHVSSRETRKAVQDHCAETGHVVRMQYISRSVYEGQPR